jgi:hypothetical protein
MKQQQRVEQIKKNLLAVDARARLYSCLRVRRRWMTEKMRFLELKLKTAEFERARTRRRSLLSALRDDKFKKEKNINEDGANMQTERKIARLIDSIINHYLRLRFLFRLLALGRRIYLSIVLSLSLRST